MGVSLLLIGLTGLFWFLGMRNADEVIGILEKLMATLLLVLTLCVGGGHVAISFSRMPITSSALRMPRNQNKPVSPMRSSETPIARPVDVSNL